MSSTLFKPDFPGSPALLPEPHQEQSAEQSRRAGSWPQRLWDRALTDLAERATPALQLEMTDRFVSFPGVREFEFALSSRVEFPACRVREMVRLSPVELEAAAAQIHDVERLLSNVLARTVREPGLIGELFREFELKLFSKDHGWREIIEGLMRLSPAFDGYRRVALVKYLQYLRARQTIMRSAFVEKTRDDDRACLHATRAVEDDAADVAARIPGETERFDISPVRRGTGTLGHDYRILPKGETVQMDLGDARELDLLLAGNRMRLYAGRDWYLVDDGGNTHPLHGGKNLVGRHSACDVVADRACKAISRTHLIIEPLGNGRVRLTDLSSHGTEVRGRSSTSP